MHRGHVALYTNVSMVDLMRGERKQKRVEREEGRGERRVKYCFF